jgi:hypothetical protein
LFWNIQIPKEKQPNFKLTLVKNNQHTAIVYVEQIFHENADFDHEDLDQG